MEKAIKSLKEKQEKVNSLKEKMKNASFFKKIGYAIAYGTAKAGLKIAELAVKAATGYVKLLKAIVEKLREKESKNS